MQCTMVPRLVLGKSSFFMKLEVDLLNPFEVGEAEDWSGLSVSAGR